MDLARFMALIDAGALIFTAADLMEDTWEGTYDLPRAPEEDPDTHVVVNDPMARKRELQTTYLSCWYVEDEESALMWANYDRENKGVAIQSTWGRLVESLDTDLTVYGGAVEYVDHSDMQTQGGNPLETFLQKRASFSSENEARLILLDPEKIDAVEIDMHEHLGYREGDTVPGPAYPVPANLSRLIEAVVLSPRMPGWEAELIKRIATKYTLEAPVQESSLSLRPPN